MSSQDMAFKLSHYPFTYCKIVDIFVTGRSVLRFFGPRNYKMSLSIVRTSSKLNLKSRTLFNLGFRRRLTPLTWTLLRVASCFRGTACIRIPFGSSLVV